MLVLRLLLMVLAIICLMDGHAEVSSSTTEMRNRGGNPAGELNKTKIEILDRKKKKPKPGKKKKPKPKPGKKTKPTKPGKNSCTLKCPTGYPETSDRGPLYVLRDSFTVMMTKHCANECKKNKQCAGFESTKCSKCRLLTDSKDAAVSKKEQVKKYCKIVKPTTTSSPTTTIPTTITTSKATSTQTSTASTSVTTTPLTTTLKTTLTSTPPTTITTTTAKPTTKTTPSPPTTPDYGDCEATNGSPCIFPFKDGSTEYNECANEKGRYYWCATSVYSSGKYKSWQYCPLDGSCPLPGGACKATNKMPCYFPFKHDGEEYNECIDDGKKLWCATSTTSSGTWNNWGYCPDDGTCPLPPKTTTTVTPITTVSPKESASTIVLVKDGEKVFSCQMDFTFESQAGFKMNSNFSSTCSPASSATKDYKNFEEYAFDITTSSGATINCKINIVIQDESSGISMATKPMEKSLECSVDESACVTISGEHFPTSCVVPFIHEGRKYQACTDKGGKDADKLWCATAVDENEEMTKWGYCSAACGYCGGKDVTEQDVKAPGAPCGYDCLINPNKPMEPKTQGINPKLLTAPEVSYYKDEMTDWNLLPNAQVQFRKGEPGVFLKCKDGFNQFPCHDSLYIKCDGNYRFSIYKAEIKDNTAEIGEFVQNDVKNVQIGCGPCPMGFIYKVGDEVCKYTSCGIHHGVPSIEACRELCDKRNCPTFVYSLEDKYCELHSVRVENPSYQEFKDYKLCAREEKNACGAEEKFLLICPDGYSEESNAPPLYLLQDWTYNKDAEDVYQSANDCATKCKKNTKCHAVVSTVCKGCQLLTSQEDTALVPHKKIKHYCFQGRSSTILDIQNVNEKNIWFKRHSVWLEALRLHGRQDVSSRKRNIRGKQHDCSYTWRKSEATLTQCTNIRNYPFQDLKDCKQKCTYASSCTAFNLMEIKQNKFCELLNCPIPIEPVHKAESYYRQCENHDAVICGINWISSKSAFTDVECTKIQDTAFTSLSSCKTDCEATSACTAINLLETENNKICQLRNCPNSALVQPPNRELYSKQWQNCPALYTNTKQNTNKPPIAQPQKGQVPNIQKCSEYCKENNECAYWTWKDNTCVVMDGFEFSYYEPGATTGYKNCLPGQQLDCPSVNTSIEGEIIPGKVNFDSHIMEACMQECLKHPKCKYWTWNLLKKCSLMSDQKMVKYEHKTFTGEKNCAIIPRCPTDAVFIQSIYIWKVCHCGAYDGSVYCNNNEWCVSLDSKTTTCLPACDAVRDKSSGLPSTNDCVCLENNTPCKDGHFCDKSNKCQPGDCEGNWLSHNQGIRPKENKFPSNRIREGIDVEDINRWPWAVQVQYNKRPGSCSGVLISCEHVLTAAHCILDLSTNQLAEYPNNDLTVLLRSTELNLGTPIGVKDTYFQRGGHIMTYKENGVEKYYPDEDIAIITLDRKINPFLKTDEGIRPIKLPDNGDLGLTDELWIAGWGLIRENTATSRLRETWEIKGYTYNYYKIILQEKDVKLCKGDSGSPGMVEQGASGNQYWVVKGIFSRGDVDCLDKDKNTQTQNGEMMNVFYYHKIFIKDKMNK